MDQINPILITSQKEINHSLIFEDANVMSMSEKKKVHLAYDQRMSHHRPLHYHSNETYPSCREEITTDLATYVYERPERLTCIYTHLMETFTEDSFLTVECTLATREQILSVHSAQHYDAMEATSEMSPTDLAERSEQDNDMYFNEYSFQAARLACGGVIAACNAVLSQEAGSSKVALALVRPPGHHACQSHEMGFCLFNSVAVAAKCSGKRTVILDWDVHHGNGTQELVWNCKDITYVSLHRYVPKGKNYFFPGTGSPIETNAGKNVNIAWTKGDMGNAEYAAAFSEIVLPVIASIQPELIIVSCGLDAAKNDLIGDCQLTPEFYGAMTKSLMCFGIPLVLALEGGYNIPVICECMREITNAMLMVTCTSPELVMDPLCESRRLLATYWDYTAYQDIPLARSAIQNILETMTALESTCHFSFRPMPQLRRKKLQHPPTRLTRGAVKRQEVADLNQALKSLVM